MFFFGNRLTRLVGPVVVVDCLLSVALLACVFPGSGSKLLGLLPFANGSRPSSLLPLPGNTQASSATDSRQSTTTTGPTSLGEAF